MGKVIGEMAERRKKIYINLKEKTNLIVTPNTNKKYKCLIGFFLKLIVACDMWHLWIRRLIRGFSKQEQKDIPF